VVVVAAAAAGAGNQLGWSRRRLLCTLAWMRPVGSGRAQEEEAGRRVGGRLS
jgi:hypothetical protein